MEPSLLDPLISAGAPAGPELWHSESLGPGPAGVPMDGPLREILTPRLRLRPFGPDDHAALHGLMSRKETFFFSERGPMCGEESWARLLRHCGHWALFGYGLFAVEERARGTLVGEVGLTGFRRSLGPGFDGLPEASWTIQPEAWGRGYAEEAARAAHDWLCSQLAPEATVCLIHRDNGRSIRLALRLGYAVTGSVRHRGYPALMFRRSAR